jgi:hypothetical protein
MAAPGPEADIDRIASRVRYGTITGHSITSSACASMVAGTVVPDIFCGPQIDDELEFRSLKDWNFPGGAPLGMRSA